MGNLVAMVCLFVVVIVAVVIVLVVWFPLRFWLSTAG